MTLITISFSRISTIWINNWTHYRGSYSVEWNFGLQPLVGHEVPYVMSNINKQLKKVCGKEPEMDKRLRNSTAEDSESSQI